MNATLTVTATETETTIALCGDLAGGAAELATAFEAAVLAVETATLVVDVAGATVLGVAGMGLVYGAFRGAPWGVQVAYRAGAWLPTLRLLLGRSGNGALGRGTPAVEPAAITA